MKTKTTLLTATTLLLLTLPTTPTHANTPHWHPTTHTTTEAPVSTAAPSHWALFDTLLTNPMMNLINWIEGDTNPQTPLPPKAPITTNLT